MMEYALQIAAGFYLIAGFSMWLIMVVARCIIAKTLFAGYQPPRFVPLLWEAIMLTVFWLPLLHATARDWLWGPFTCWALLKHWAPPDAVGRNHFYPCSRCGRFFWRMPSE